MDLPAIVISSDKTSSSGFLSTSSPLPRQPTKDSYSQYESTTTNIAQDVEMGEDEDELPAWHFARRYGLAKPFDAIDPRTNLPSILPRESEDPNDTKELLPVSEDVLNALHDMHNEKLDINKEAAGILYWILKECEEECQFDICEILEKERSHGKTNFMEKLPLPLLRTDEEVDKHRAQRLGKVSVMRHGLRRLEINIEADEGMEWSKAMLDLPNKKMEEVANERLEVPRNMIQIMHSFMVDDWVNGDEFTMLTGSEGSRKVKAFLN
jgi:hypothetical protein